MLNNITFDLNLISQNNGYAISFTGITIVFITLCITSLFVAVIPYIIAVFTKIFPEKKPVTAPRVVLTKTHKKDDDDCIAVAIALALHKKKTEGQI